MDFIKRKKTIFIIILGIIITAGWLWYGEAKSAEGGVSYVTETIEKGMLISSISGVGQVLALEQVDINPKAAGDIVYFAVKNGDEIEQGHLIAQIDSRDASRRVNEAQTSLETAKLELEELLAPADDYTFMQAENTLADAWDSLTRLKTTQENNYQQALKDKENAEDDLESAYEDGFNAVVDAFLKLPSLMTDLKNILFSSDFYAYQWNIDYYAGNIKTQDAPQYRSGAYDSYQTGRKKYDANFQNYKNTSRYSDIAAIEGLIDETYETTKAIAEAIKEANNLIDVYEYEMTGRNSEIPGLCASHQSSINAYTSQTNSHLSGLLSAQRSITDYRESIADAIFDLDEIEQNNPLETAQAERSVEEKEQRITDLKNGASEFEIRNKKINIRQKENDLLEARQDLADYYVRAPFSGMIANVDAGRGDSVGAGTAIASLVTFQKIALITLNEIDAAKVMAGQKVTLEFDAIEDLSATGKVAEVDVLGTVNQGVVSYDVKIGLDVQDERIKPGMTVSAVIIIEAKPNAVLAPLSAVETQGDVDYVELLVNGQAQRQEVIIGASNDFMVEIVNGLGEGDEIITQTVSNGATQSDSSQGDQSNDAMKGVFRMMR